MDYLAHGSLSNFDRRWVVDELYREFGKGGKGVERGLRTAAALILQASIDISFGGLYASLLSPEALLQLLGRCNRFGELRRLVEVHIISALNNSSERGAAQVVYSLELSRVFEAFLRRVLALKSTLTLAELYQMYNQFYAENRGLVLQYLQDRHNKSAEGLREYHPKKYRGKQDKDTERLCGGRNLRSLDGSCYFSMRREDGTWLPPDEVMSGGKEVLHRFENNHDNGIKLMNVSVMRMCMKGLVAAGFEQYRKYLNNRAPIPCTLAKWRKLSRNPETPLPDFTQIYVDRVGPRKV